MLNKVPHLVTLTEALDLQNDAVTSLVEWITAWISRCTGVPIKNGWGVYIILYRSNALQLNKMHTTSESTFT